MSRGLLYLSLVSLIWAFSFGLIRHFLAGIDPAFLAFARLTLATLLLLPWFRPSRLPPTLLPHGPGDSPVSLSPALLLLGLGALQYGVMYLLLFRSFAFLQAYEVVLFTLFTPVYVALLDDALGHTFRPRHLLAAFVAVLAAAVVKWQEITSPTLLLGFLHMQGANLAFASGQVLYRRLPRPPGAPPDSAWFALLFAGGALLTGCFTLLSGSWREVTLTPLQILIVVYLGLVASGLGFFLWNRGAALVRSISTVAVFNNVNIPLGVAVSLLVFHESAPLFRLVAGALLLALAFRLAAPSSRPARKSPA